MQSKKVLASAVISELQSSDMYLTLVARLFDIKANLNGVRVTEAFLDEIVENESKYVCHPLYADIRGLIANRTVGHMYNARTGEFHSTQIGAFYRFEKEVSSDNVHLIGYARVPKRNKALCKALSDLFTDNKLKFSFEVNCGVYEEDEEGTVIIDANPRNYWEGEAVVTFPACESAVAQELIAECLCKGDEIMADENIVQNENETIVSEASENAADMNIEENTETQIEETEVAETEVAETVYVVQERTEIDNVRAVNCDTGEETEQRVIIETVTRTPVQIAESDNEEKEENEEDDDEEVVAESENASEGSSQSDVVAQCADENDDEKEDNEDEKQNAEVESGFLTMIAELQSAIEALRKEIAELKPVEIPEAQQSGETEEVVIAEKITVDAAAETVFNPFIASITAPKKYSLLDREEKTTNKYALLERAD